MDRSADPRSRWRTVREDYSENGDAWNFFTHDHARSRAYRWGEDGINDCVVQGNQGAVNRDKQGTKVAAHCRVRVGAGQTQVIRLRLSKASPDQKGNPFGKQFDEVFPDRLREADEFYKSVTPPSASEDEARVMRQAVAGMLWSKQFFFFDGDNWLDEHHSNPLHTGYRQSRNSEWFHMLNKDIIRALLQYYLYYGDNFKIECPTGSGKMIDR